MEKLKRLPYKNTKVKLMEQLLKRVIESVKKVNKVKAVSFTNRLNGLIDKYNDRSDDIVLADEIVTEVANQLAELFEEIKKENKLPEGIPNIEVKAFYDILKSVAEQYGFINEYTEEQYIALAKDVKEVVDDKTQYIDWDKKADIKAQLKVQIILTLAKHHYPPATRDEVFKAIFEQAENFKKNRSISEAETAVSKKSSGKKAQEIKMIPKGSMLEDVEADDDVRRLVHNMMELYEGTTILKIVTECQKEYQERYFSMKTNDWRHLLRDYIRKVTERPELQEEEAFRFVMAG